MLLLRLVRRAPVRIGGRTRSLVLGIPPGPIPLPVVPQAVLRTGGSNESEIVQRPIAGPAFRTNHPERPNIRAAVDGFAACLLRRHVSAVPKPHENTGVPQAVAGLSRNCKVTSRAKVPGDRAMIRAEDDRQLWSEQYARTHRS